MGRYRMLPERGRMRFEQVDGEDVFYLTPTLGAWYGDIEGGGGELDYATVEELEDALGI